MTSDFVPARLPEAAFVERPSGPPVPLPMPAPKLGEIVPGVRQYVRNPHLTSVGLSAGLLLGAAGGVLWSVYRDDPHADLAFGVFLATIVLLIACVRRFNAWDQR